MKSTKRRQVSGERYVPPSTAERSEVFGEVFGEGHRWGDGVAENEGEIVRLASLSAVRPYIHLTGDQSESGGGW